MSFYDDASWLLIPSGIEEDIVFAQKPISGLGDLTFTRASDATYTDSTGVVRRSPYNLVLQSEDFSNVAWGKASSGVAAPVVTANQSLSPTGTNTADKIVFPAVSTATNFSVVFNFTPLTTSGSNTASVYLKGEVGGEKVYFFMTVGSTWTNLLCTLTTEWQRFTFPFTGGANSYFHIGLDLRAGSGQVAQSGSTIYAWGAQLVEGSSALDYFPTTNRQDVPRIDFRNADGTLSSCGRLLLEPQRTNSIRNSSMVGAVAGTPGTLPTNWDNVLNGLSRTIVGVGTESGLPYVDVRLSGTATSTTADIRPESFNIIAAVTGQTWSESYYFKVIGAPAAPNAYQIAMYERNSGGSAVATGAQNFTPTSTLQRFTFTRTLNGGATVAFVQPIVNFTLTNGATYDFTIRIAAPQMELGAYATTWVPTTTAAVTRLADAFSRSNIFTNGLISSAGGTWFVEISDNASVLRDNGSGLFIGDTAFANNGNQIIIRSAAPAAAARFSIIRYISGTATTLHTTTTNKIKVAVKWNGSVMDVFVNGVKVSASNLFTTTTMQNMIAGAGQIFEIDQMLLAATPLSDAECIQLTTL